MTESVPITNNWVNDFVEHCILNQKDTIEYFSEIKETREYSMSEFKNIADQLLKFYKQFLWNNGVFTSKDFDFKDLDDEQKTTFALLTLQKYQPQNKYRQLILDYYYSNLDKPISELELEKALVFNGNNITKHYYSMTPPTYLKLEKTEVREPHVEELQNVPSLISNISNFIKLGKSIQFNVAGFPQNELYYLVMGICIYDCLNSTFETFHQLMKHIKSYIQLFLTSKCLELNEENYNLVTFINFGKEKKPNLRYQCARKYFEDTKIKNTQTQFKSNEKGEYIETIYSSKEEYSKKLQELEQIYSSNKKITKELIVKWFDGQLLTRSTCLVGVILIVLMEYPKRIQFKKDEMPDWKAIAQGNFDNTYDLDEFKFQQIQQIQQIQKPLNLTLGQILLVTRQYISILENSKN